MWGLKTVVWTICLACVQPMVLSWFLPFRSNRDRPHPALGALSGKVECFSDYMTLKIPRSRVPGLRQWLATVLHLPGTPKAPDHLDSLLAKCGYLLHRAPEGDSVFRALYSACFVQKEKANYRLEIRIFRKGAKRLEQSDSYIMKCPVIMSRLVQQSVRCDPTFIQVSRPLPLRNDGGQIPWLLSFRGELVASLEDASLMGLDVDINATMITVKRTRQDLLQKQEVQNTTLELLPLWLLSGYYAYSFEATCPPVSAQPESEVLVYIPRQRLGLVKRGSHVEETLSPKFLRVHQSNSFTVMEDRDFLVISIPTAGLLQIQPCQEAEGASGTQAFYRVDLSLGFAEKAAPVRWIVENFFHCVGSGEESPASTATVRTTSPLASGPETSPAEMLFSTSSWFQNAQLTAQKEPFRGFVRWPAKDTAEKLAPSVQTTRLAGETWTFTDFLFPRARQEGGAPQDPPGKAGSSPPLQTSATLSSEPMVATQAGPLDLPGKAGSSSPLQTSATLSSEPMVATQAGPQDLPGKAGSPPPPLQTSTTLSSEPMVATQAGPQDLTEKAGSSPPLQTSATLSSEPMVATQAGPQGLTEKAGSSPPLQTSATLSSEPMAATQAGPQDLPGKASSPPPPLQTSTTLSSEPMVATQAGPQDLPGKAGSSLPLQTSATLSSEPMVATSPQDLPGKASSPPPPLQTSATLSSEPMAATQAGPQDLPGKSGSPPPSLQTSTTFSSEPMAATQAGPQDLPGKSGSPPPSLQTSTTLSSESMAATQAGPGPLQPVFLTPTALTTHWSSEVSSPGWPPRGSDESKVLLGSESPAAPTEGPGAMRDELDPEQTPGSPPLLGGLSGSSVVVTEPILREPAQASEEFQPWLRPLASSLAEEVMLPHPAPGMLQENAGGPLHNDGGPSKERTRLHLDPSSPGPSQDMGLTILPEMGATITSPRGNQPVTSVPLETSEPEVPGRHRVGPAVPLTTLPKSSLASISKKPEASSSRAPDGTSDRESAPKWSEGWHKQEAVHTTSPLLPHTLILWAESTVPSLDDSRAPFPGQREAWPEGLSPAGTNRAHVYPQP